jgi:(p)ppGpp synthase/HD superfamily hydrolase
MWPDAQRRVVSYDGDVNEQIAALLHGVLEDTKVRQTELPKEGVPEEALVTVRLLTTVDGEPKATTTSGSASMSRRVGSSCSLTSPATPDPTGSPSCQLSCGSS